MMKYVVTPNINPYVGFHTVARHSVVHVLGEKCVKRISAGHGGLHTSVLAHKSLNTISQVITVIAE